jgi:glucan phosphoethanolaminetransferase (alkaline phosphatase superfamily)
LVASDCRNIAFTLKTLNERWQLLGSSARICVLLERSTAITVSRFVFALLWTILLAWSWDFFKRSYALQTIINLGVGLTWPLSLVYVSVVYLLVITALVWVGFVLFLLFSGTFRWRRFALGAIASCGVLIPAYAGGMLLAGRLLTPYIWWSCLWVALVLALWLASESPEAVKDRAASP